MDFKQLNGRSLRQGCGRAFGTFGELLQGVLPGDQDFLVTLPINRFSQAVFQPETTRSTLQVIPAEKQKSCTLAVAILSQYGLPPGGTLTITSDLPIGKGFASSSCDLVATARAIANAYDIDLRTEDIEYFLRQIEPTDGVMYDGYVTFFHRDVRLGAFLGDLPPLIIVSADEGGEIDTVAFNTIPKPFTEIDKREYQVLHKEIAAAFIRKDISMIGQIATRSAHLNQKLRPKALLASMITICQSVEGLGVVTAHSGTVLGILLSPTHPLYIAQRAELEKRILILAGNMTVYHTLSFVDALHFNQMPCRERVDTVPHITY